MWSREQRFNLINHTRWEQKFLKLKKIYVGGK